MYEVSLSLSLSLSLISFVFRNIKLAYIARKIALIQHDVKDTDIEFMTDFYRHFIDLIPLHPALSPIFKNYIHSTSKIREISCTWDMGLQSVWPDDFMMEFHLIWS